MKNRAVRISILAFACLVPLGAVGCADEDLAAAPGVPPGPNDGSNEPDEVVTPPSEGLPEMPVPPMVVGGHDFTLALKRNGTVFAWGQRRFGVLGNGVSNDYWTAEPQRVLNIDHITRIAAGDSHSLALRSDGVVFSWGLDSHGQLGYGKAGGSQDKPRVVAGVANITAVAAGENFSMALRADGQVLTWGYNSAGQLGQGDAVARATPTLVPGLNGVLAIAAGGEHALAVQADGSVFGWGKNIDGQLGLSGRSLLRNRPTRISGLDGLGIKQLAAGAFHSLALAADGTVYGWGASNRGQVGRRNPDTVTGFGQFNTPGQVPGVQGITAITAGEEHSMALRHDGAVITFGNNGWGRLGNGSSGISSQSTYIPQIVHATPANALTGVIAIGAGQWHSLVALDTGALGCFGSNWHQVCGRLTATDDVVFPLEVGPGFSLEQ